jgi:glutamine cyclotransferase
MGMIVLLQSHDGVFVYDETLKMLSSFKYTTHTNQGWGITFDPVDQVFHVSDGSDNILVWNLHFQQIRKFRVSLFSADVEKYKMPYLEYLNELE